MSPIPKRIFYFVRHGRTDANAQELMCGGEWDIALNETGIDQATKLAPQLIDINPKPELLVISPMLRAQQTAKILNAVLNVETVTVEGLREWRVGDWESKPWGDVPNPFTSTEEPPNGETRKVFENRVSDALVCILESEVRVPILVSHGAVAHALFTILGVDRLLIENCAPYRISPQAQTWIIEKVV